MSYVQPTDFVTKMIDSGEAKVFMSTRDTLIRAYMAGAILALAAAFAVAISVQTGELLAGAILFPVGFCPLYLMGFEHSIVNMFLFPSGLMLGGDFSVTDYLLWNEIPTVVGNLVGGPTFVGLTLYATHHRTGQGHKPRAGKMGEPVRVPAE